MASFARGTSFRRGLSVRLGRFRRKFQHHPDDTSTELPQTSSADPNVITGLQSLGHEDDVSQELTATSDDDIRTLPDQGRSDIHNFQQNPTRQSILDDDVSGIVISSDLWSKAYLEAIDSFGKDIDSAIFMGSTVAQLFTELERIGKDATQDSVFIRGVAYLRSIQVPLERFKLALDLATPLGSLDPTASTVLGVVRSVTALAISFATADLEFAKQIGEMLEQISYIDDCDTLGQRANKTDIHKALVSVYREIIEFYRAAHDILTKKGRRLAMKMILETDRLPNIIQDFLRHADVLRKLIEKATWEIVEDIKAMLYDREIARWLESSKVSLQSRYHARLQDLRNDEACEFLLAHPSFAGWYHAPDSQKLVILGDMGSGKTVAMAFLVDELNQRNEHQLPRPKVCYHYCHNDETGQVVYVLSALILALLEQLSGLKRTFYDWYKQNQASGILEPATSTRKLEEFLELVLATMDRWVFIVIDGLDECDRTSRKLLLRYLKNLSEKTPRLKILLSSRPEEEILVQLEHVPKIEMGSDANRDTIIVRHTVEGQLSHLSADVKELVTKSLSHLAQGSAIWTKMTVELIEVRGIRALGPMRLFLDEMPLPRELSSLYDNLLLRSSLNDPENQDLAAIALRLLAVACRPLSIQELAWAVALAAAPHKINTVAALAELVDHQRILSLVHPFVTRIDFTDIKKRQVQLVHQSVREFVLWKWSCPQDSATSTALDQTMAHCNTQNLEAFVLQICIKYLLLLEIDSTPLFSEEQVAIDELPQDVDLFSDRRSFEYDRHCTWESWEENMIHYDPSERGFGEFFVYASNHWLKHFGAIENETSPSLPDIETLCQKGSTRLQNWINQNCRPDCAIKARFEFYSHLYDPLSITSLYGSDSTLRNMLQNSNFDEDKYLPLPALSAADQILQWGDLSKLRILFLEGKLSHQLRNLDFFRLVLKQWSNLRVRHDDWELAFDLVKHALDTLVEDRWGSELLCIAARAGCMPLIQRLVDGAQHNAELRAEILRGFQAIGEAVLGNHLDVVEYLLSKTDFEAHLHHLNSDSESVLHLASGPCNPAMFRLLVSHFQDGIHLTDVNGDTALLRIIKSTSNSENRYKSAEIIISHANPNMNEHTSERKQDSQQDHQNDPLQVARQLGDTKMCRLLISEGRVTPL